MIMMKTRMTALHCNALHRKHTAKHCTTLHHTAAHCTTLHHTAARCTTLQHMYDLFDNVVDDHDEEWND